MSGDAISFKTVTVIIPCYMEEQYIEQTLKCIREQKLSGVEMEILVADGMSTDRTREIVSRIAQQDARVKLIDNPERTQANGLNHAIKVSKGELIIRADAHAEYTPDYVQSCIQISQATNAENVGGAQRPRWKTAFQDCVARAFKSFLGSGGAKWRNPVYEGCVDHVWLGAFRRDVFKRVGLFDPEASPNEDAEIDIRIIKAGGKVYLSPRIEAYYYPRNSLSGVARQYYYYGYSRFRTFMIEGTLVVRPLVPFAFWTSFALLGIAALFSNVLAIAFLSILCLYIVGIGIEGIRQSAGGRWWYPVLVSIILTTMQLSHATGFWMGILSGRKRRTRSSEIEKLSA